MSNFILALTAPGAYFLTALLSGRDFDWYDLVYAMICYFAALGVYYGVDYLVGRI